MGALFTVLGIALSWPIAAFYGEPEVQPLFAVLSLSFVITALGTTQKALLTRDMDFKSLELRLMAGSFAAGVVGIALAAGGYGAWAIIGQQVVLACVSTALLWGFTRWRPRFHFSLESLRGLFGFSLNVFGTRLLFYGNRNADNLLIGRFIGAAGLGVYGLAYNVMLAPMSRLGWPIAEVLFPAFSKMQDESERMASAWVRVNRLVGSLTIPASLGLILVAPEFVTAVLGDRWNEAIPIIRLLGWVSLLQSLGTLNSAVLLARDRSGTLLRYAVVAFVASVIAFVVGLEWGIVGVAVGYALVSTFIEPYYAWLTARSLERLRSRAPAGARRRRAGLGGHGLRRARGEALPAARRSRGRLEPRPPDRRRDRGLRAALRVARARGRRGGSRRRALAVCASSGAAPRGAADELVATGSGFPCGPRCRRSVDPRRSRSASARGRSGRGSMRGQPGRRTRRRTPCGRIPAALAGRSR